MAKKLKSVDQPLETITWRCFHCGFATSNENEARAHFGDDSDDQALCVMWASIDDAERAHAYQQVVLELNATREEVLSLNAAIEAENAEGMRMFREIESRMHQELRKAEEDGYARGLRDAKKHPEELGLCYLPELTAEEIDILKRLGDGPTFIAKCKVLFESRSLL